MDNVHYQYMIHQKQQQQKIYENWEVKEEPTTCPLESESDLVSCNVCKRNFRSKKALWGHRRCCKSATRADNRSKHDVLQSGWLVTAKRGQKPVITTTSPQFVAACILIDLSSGKNCEKEKAVMEESQPLDDTWISQFVCGNKFACVICGKAFPSYQALGGHKASHGKEDTMVNLGKSEKEVKYLKRLISRDHRCEVETEKGIEKEN
ncbi:Zinc finger protein ZAT9 [Carex littledalei]|uniref:Zinc finger protein ZAT9 n=1 Tax=Carex littledalei TaxID=544730 RepID=A0A833VM04_9POAL|nr:Zinc finger protein ZAT9 [Carex littledalei]